MRDLLLFAIIMGLVPITLMKPWIGVVGWYWVGMMSPHGLTWGFMQTFPLAMVIGGATLIALVLTKDRRPLPFTREIALLVVLAAYVTLTSYLAINPSGAWSQWTNFMKILAITFVAPMLVYGEKRVLVLLIVITSSLAFYGLKGGLFSILTGGQHMVLGPPRSFLAGNTYIGMAMVMILPMILVTARMLREQWVDWGRGWIQKFSVPAGWGFYGVFWLTAVAILATYSRGALLGILAVAPFIFLRMRHKLVLVAMAVLLVVGVGVTVPDKLMARWQTIQTYEEDQSAMQRIQAWGVNWNMAQESPLVGMGFGNRGMGYDWWIQFAEFEGEWRHILSPHSTYFQVLGEHGFVGLGIYLLMLVFMLLTLRRIQMTAKQRTGQLWLAEYAWAMKIGLIGFMVSAAFLDMAYFELIYAFLALTVIMRRELDEGMARVGGGKMDLVPTEPRGAVPRYPGFVADNSQDAVRGER
ncbi:MULTISPECIES: putative O-glycosylation ligase, exosortase A system-associated [unclassified Ectothiorhodospira]|uniref:putative O-glycosylation ligase, exosortase A system-associated n=1 Tax=unclassified Ectothiorhodospira TaxID=2684909 RepID=UPI001EE829A9|nr:MULTISPECIES: putative O-glycosylation ligase, exosortase A system-associated [unclassified Ectothiorhodospira]MCG5517093.1 putative O-glycosylation ligase, exosortase A system-associated [Ectothiorhodospira sp. 9100]MCG5519755.1 putative O-glycosylation ligase, exosortase A system-associated [Ectothiorhodospira sp. 9905]